MRNYLLLTLLALVSISLLGGCGFHLRGDVKIKASMLPVYVKDNTSSQIKLALQKLLDENKVTQTQQAGDAKLVLIVDKEQFKRRVLSVGGSGKVQEFSLQYLVTYSVSSAEKGLLLSKQEIRLQRDLRFDESAVLAKAQEEAQRNQDMVNDAARQLLRRLQSI